MSASERDVPAQPCVVAGVSMRDLLASCAAAEAVSRPPREPAPRATEPVQARRVRRPEAA
ncbi:hypothetical protein [Streptomyces sp. NPDC050564]|jgi:hypothetical protein|uniref:hypothetical protein n=1 Tax=Streptomyces sp. NPDC050564 TaxID=3365631 RepID=UPI00378AB5DE